jgi:cytochrome oxidase Cu insertion factor (SCO1/SenC/PrrC family)
VTVEARAGGAPIDPEGEGHAAEGVPAGQEAAPHPGSSEGSLDGSASGPTPRLDPAAAARREAAFAAGPPKMPRRVIYGGIAVVLVVGLGFGLVDRLATSSPPAKPVPASTAPGPSVPVVPENTTQLHASLPAFLGLTALHRRAPGFSLVDATTRSDVTLAGLHGHVVVLSFANAACNDICPVLASELVQADAQLSPGQRPVTLVTINSDPLDTGASPTLPIVNRTGLGTLANWRFLTGSVHQLNEVWVHYGISITADRGTGVASHNNFLYFIAPDGRLSWRATPFANESTAGRYSLSPAEVNRFAQGVADYARRLAGSS